MDTVQSNIWDAYNLLMLGPDTDRLRKVLARYELFRRTLDVPGDIVECGVFKGSGLMMWLKMLAIFAPGSMKRVVGFDMFTSFPAPEGYDAAQVEAFVNESQFDGVTTEEIEALVTAAGIDAERCELVAGDIVQTAPAYVAERPGLRVSLLNLDLDLEEGTFAALEAFWPRVVPGGIVVLDEYGVHRWTESNAVDRFFAGKDARLQTLPWAKSPTAYVVKGGAG